VALTTEGGTDKFNIHVKLDDPIKGQEITCIAEQCTERKSTRVVRCSLSAATAEWLASLTGKHAIYLVVEGPEVKQPEQRQQWGQRPQQPQRPKGLFTLHGIGFSDGSQWEMPAVPQVTITADGKKLNIPAQPVMTTNQNGYTECNHYQVYAPLKVSSQIKATANDPTVKVAVGTITDGRATVRCTWRGKEKIFLIN
jgi:hypothetical protein